MITQVANSKNTPYVVTYISVGRASRPAIASAQLIRRERRSAFRFFGRITYYVLCFISPSGATCAHIIEQLATRIIIPNFKGIV